MSPFIHQFIEQLIATSLLEWLAVVLAIFYLLLAIRENVWCWPAAFSSTTIYVYLFFDVSLYMESFLNFYYMAMAIYGWYQWRGSSKTNPVESLVTKIICWNFKRHAILILITSVVVFASSWLLKQYTDQDFALIDSFTTWFAILATYMVTQKVIDNWLYWIVIDLVSIYLFTLKGFALTAVLFLCYVILAAVGWFSWKKRLMNSSSYQNTSQIKTT
ncbi:MAG: nicotinamide riboside transporter PnuC [Kangiellaceae bacterium]|nr:nicotinamide riboside transporter PnuC [Kangiellaceae bacterium]